MQKFVIVGNGVAGIEAALALRARKSPVEASICVIGSESDFFFSRTALMYAYMDVMERRDLEPFERESYERQHIELIRDHVVDVDGERQLVTLASGKSIAYDKLLLAVGAKPRLFPWQGVDEIETGLVHFVSMQDLDQCEQLTPSTREAVVIGGGLIGIELVECLSFHGVKTTFLVREPYFWPMALGQEEGEMITEHIRHHGVDLRHHEEITEALVDASGRVRAVRTDKDEEIACQMLGIAVGVIANCDFLKETTTPVAVGRGIQVNRAFETSVPNVYAAGDCCEIDIGTERPLIETIWYSAKLHGRLAAASMLGDTIRYEPPLFYNSTKFMEIEFTTVGQAVDLPDGTMSVYRKHPSKEISQRIVFNDDREVIGFNMLGSRWDHTVLERWIHQRRDVAWVREHLHDAQFDHEFGRAKLEQFTEKEIPV